MLILEVFSTDNFRTHKDRDSHNIYLKGVKALSKRESPKCVINYRAHTKNVNDFFVEKPTENFFSVVLN